MDSDRKRARPDAASNGNGGLKKFKQETETGIGSKSKPCTKFFSTSGCPFGEGCHFLHYVPGGHQAVAQMSSFGRNLSIPPASRGQGMHPSFSDGSSSPAVKTRLCNKYSTAEGCRFGEKCHFAHGEWELGKPAVPLHEDSRGMGSGLAPGRFGGQASKLPSPGLAAAARFGTSATAKISVDASLAGAIIGKAGVNSKQICRVTGARLSIRDHEADQNLKNIELEGTFDQIEQASTMVRELIVNVGSGSGPRGPGMAVPGGKSNFKTKVCEKFAKGSCAFGERCHFIHGDEEARRYAM